MNNQLSARKDVLNQSFDCDKQLLSLSEKISKIRLVKERLNDKVQLEKKRNSDLTVLKDNLAVRCNLATILHQAVLSLKYSFKKPL